MKVKIQKNRYERTTKIVSNKDQKVNCMKMNAFNFVEK